MLADAHCHLESFKKLEIPPNLLVFTSGYSHESNRKNLEIASSHENVFCCLGIAPQTAQKEENLEEKLEEWANWIKAQKGNPKFSAIGEIGLDFHWAKAEEEKRRQDMCLDKMLDLASSLNLPAVFHCRDAYPQLFSKIESFRPKRFMLHCFSGDEADARQAVDLGALISIPPLPSKKRKKAVKEAGLSFLVAETDAPYLGRDLTDINTSLRIISSALGIPEEEAGEETFRNTCKFFGVNHGEHD